MPYVPPGAIQRLPFELLRAQRYPRDPEAMGQAAQEYVEGDPLPVWYAPQRMGFSRWKTPPHDVAWGQRVAGVLTALEQEHLLLSQLHAANYQPPTMTSHQAASAMGAERLPQPSDNEDPALAEDLYPIARNALPTERLAMTAGELTAYVKAHQEAGNRRRFDADSKRERALAQAHEQVDKIDAITSDARSYNDPWWSR